MIVLKIAMVAVTIFFESFQCTEMFDESSQLENFYFEKSNREQINELGNEPNYEQEKTSKLNGAIFHEPKAKPRIKKSRLKVPQKADNVYGVGMNDTKSFKPDSEPCTFTAPKIKNARIQYRRKKKFGNTRLFAEYHCNPGFKMIKSTPKNYTLVCKNGVWSRRKLSKKPLCKKIRHLRSKKPEKCSIEEKESCDQLCFKSRNSFQCGCHRGYNLVNGRCVDINECHETPSVCGNGGKCLNRPGSYDCICSKGYQKQGRHNKIKNNLTCVDVNECLLRNGRGFCEGKCRNLVGNFTCSCENIKGTKLSKDGRTCEDDDLCHSNNGGCSHTCVSLGDETFCSCPSGFVLDKDWRTCVDIDECLYEKYCEHQCVNSIGSYECMNTINEHQSDQHQKTSAECSDGFFDKATGECYDIPSEEPHNTFTVCPPLYPPIDGYLECSRPINTMEADGRVKITNLPGTECRLKCPETYKNYGKFQRTCGKDGKWFGEDDGYCSSSLEGSECPEKLIAEMRPGNEFAKVKIPFYESNIRSDNDLRIKPTWIKNEKGFLYLNKGIHNVSFFLKYSEDKELCNMKIIILAGEPPQETYCPQSQRFEVDSFYSVIQADWKEPTFTDNVQVINLTSNVQNSRYFGIGSHLISYEAHDSAGWKSASCDFKIVVSKRKRYHIPN